MFEYPENPPEWLAAWQTPAEMDCQFPLPTQMMGRRILVREKNLRLSWGKRTLHATIGPQSCTWRRDDNGRWQEKCTCGAPEGRCVHAFMAHILLQMAAQKEGWTMPESSAAPRKTRTPPETEPAPQTTPPPVPSGRKRLSLRVEMNCNSADGTFAVQFFESDGENREQLFLSWLRNYASDATCGKSRVAWPENDEAFLKWILPELRLLDARTMSGSILRIPREKALSWLLHWKEQPERFLNRLTGEGVLPPQASPLASFHLELTRFQQEYHLCALFLSTRQERLHVHQICEMLRKDTTGLLQELLFSKCPPPLPWPHLRQFFGNGPLALRRNEVCEQLPRITGGRLDLLEPGRLVRFVRGQPPPFELSLSLDDSNAFVLSLSLDGRRIPLRKETQELCDIRPEGEGFLVRVCPSPPMKQLSGHIQELLRRAGAAQLPSQERIRIIATDRTAALLQEFWKAIPPQILTRHSPTVQGITGERPASASVELALRENCGLVQLSAHARLGEVTLPVAELARLAETQQSFYHHPSRGWLSVDVGEIRNCHHEMQKYHLDDEGQLLLRNDAAKILKAMPAAFHWEQHSVPLAERLRKEHLEGIPRLPESLTSILRSYQRDGVRFLLERAANGIGAILADDMGLGKTLQLLAAFEAMRGQGGSLRALVVCPASVIDTWVGQAARFCPALSVTAIKGGREQRERLIARPANLLVTHYALLRADVELLQKTPFDILVVDEAQAIKNPSTALSHAVRAIPATTRFAVTGTPLENSIRDLCSILDFVCPGVCGPMENFSASWFPNIAVARIRRILDVVMLRRTKQLVAAELPPKTEETVFLDMPDDFRAAYLEQLTQQRDRAAETGLAGLFAAIMSIRRFCCDPALLQKELPSPKTEYLVERLHELLSSGHSVLVFSQFTSLLARLHDALDREGIPWKTITGDTPVEQRPQIVGEFNDSPAPQVFLLSLKAAGTGLNLTRADYVFLFDPWWNPAVENQAIDRTHRLGQRNPVFAYRLILRDSIEEKVLRILHEKRELFQNVVEGAGASGESPLTLEELKGLLS